MNVASDEKALPVPTMLATILMLAGPLAPAPNGAAVVQTVDSAEPDNRAAQDAPGAVAQLQARSAVLREEGRAALERGAKLEAAIALHGAGQIDFGLSELHQCRRSYETVLELARELEHPLLLSLAFAHLGAIHEQFGELKEAREQLEEGRYWLGRVPEGQPQVERLICDFLGGVQLEEGDLTGARTSLERALDLARTDGDQRSEVALRVRMGTLFWREGHPEEALAWHADAVELARRLGQPELLAHALKSAAAVHEWRSEYGLARKLLEGAAAVAETERMRNAVLGQLGNIEYRTGRAEAALEHYTEVLAYARRSGHRGLERSALVSLGLAAHKLGDLDLASSRLEEALDLLGAEGLPAQRAEALRTLSFVVQERGDLSTPVALLKEALTLARAAKDRVLEAKVLSAHVALLYHRGEYAEAMEPARSVLALGRELRLPDIEATGLRDLAELNLRQGRISVAREMSEQAKALFREIGDPRDLQSALLTAFEIADLDQGAEAMAEIVREAEACFVHAPHLDPERAAMQRSREVFALWGECSQDLVARQCSSATSPGAQREAIAEGFQRAGAWKGRALWQGIAEQRRGAHNAQTIALRREHDDALTARDDALLAIRDALREGRGEERLAELRAGLADLDRRSAAIEERLRAASPADAALDVPQGVDAEDLARILGHDRVLIEFVDGKNRLYAYTLKEGVLDFREIAARSEVDERVARFLGGMSRRDALAGPADVARRGKELYALLCEPLLADVAADAALVFVPSASLAALPFEALVVDAAQDPASFDEVEFVLDRREVCYAASTPVLALLADAGPRLAHGTALILGDPLSGDEAKTLDGRNLPRLIGTRDEALAIAAELEASSTDADVGHVYADLAARLGDRRSLSIEGQAVELYLGAEATPERLTGELRRFSILHCASHGLLDANDPRGSGLLLSPDGTGRGLVRLAEILDLDLDLDLAVLSACDTARGAIQRGEGVRSLASAFHHAGARSVVASLWPVEDRAAEQVMVAFHRAYGDETKTASRALREARLTVRHGVVTDGGLRGRPLVSPRPVSRAHEGHPYYWAPFVLSGTP